MSPKKQTVVYRLGKYRQTTNRRTKDVLGALGVIAITVGVIYVAALAVKAWW